MAAPRILAAALIALVVSTPLVLRVFSPEIRQQVFVDQLHDSHQNINLVDGSQPQADATRVQKQIAADQLILAGHLPQSVTSPALSDAQQAVATATTTASAALHTKQIAYEAWQCELYGAGIGCQGASNRTGPGPLANAKHLEYDQAASAYDQAEQQLTAAKQTAGTAGTQVAHSQVAVLAQAQDKAHAELPGLQSQLTSDNVKLAALRQEGGILTTRSDGILAQLRALSALDRSNSTLKYAHLALAALLFLIEIMPVLAKVLVNLGPPGAYDIVAKADDDEVVDNRRVARQENRMILEDKSDVRIKGEQDMRGRELTLIQFANAIVEQKMKTVIEDALAAWAQQASAAAATTQPTPTTIPDPTAPGPAAPGTVRTPGPSTMRSPRKRPRPVAPTNNVIVLPDSANL